MRIECVDCDAPVHLPPVPGKPGFVSITALDGWSAPPLRCPTCTELAPERTRTSGGGDGAQVDPITSSAPLRISRSQLEKEINGALKQAIDAHGPITRQSLPSASKRVISTLKRVGIFKTE